MKTLGDVADWLEKHGLVPKSRPERTPEQALKASALVSSNYEPSIEQAAPSA